MSRSCWQNSLPKGRPKAEVTGKGRAGMACFHLLSILGSIHLYFSAAGKHMTTSAKLGFLSLPVPLWDSLPHQG